MIKITSSFTKKEGKHQKYRRYSCFECLCGHTGVIRADTTRKIGCPKCNPQTKHNMTDTPEYNSWKGMKRRCFNKKSIEYKRYGAMGITICDRWLGGEGFENFIQDMGKKPRADYSIDRTNPYGNYEPDNCRWADATTQSNNKRFFGKRILCVVCDKPFLRGREDNIYCSVSCRTFGAKKPGEKRYVPKDLNKKRKEKYCQRCKIKFQALSFQKYCSYACCYQVEKERALKKNRLLRKHLELSSIPSPQQKQDHFL